MTALVNRGLSQQSGLGRVLLFMVAKRAGQLRFNGGGGQVEGNCVGACYAQPKATGSILTIAAGDAFLGREC
jgi:hypothetical protein